MYYKAYGQIYGVKIRRPFIQKLLVSIPLINLLYTYKAELNITHRTPKGEPVDGLFEKFRIFKNQKRVKFSFISFEHPMSNVLVSLRIKDGRGSFVSESKKYMYFPETEYKDSIMHV